MEKGLTRILKKRPVIKFNFLKARSQGITSIRFRGDIRSERAIILEN